MSSSPYVDPIPSPCCDGFMAWFVGNALDGAPVFECSSCATLHVIDGAE